MSAVAKKIVGETVMADERVVNNVLQQVARIVQRNDVAPMDRIETLYAYLAKSRRELFGKVD